MARLSPLHYGLQGPMSLFHSSIPTDAAIAETIHDVIKSKRHAQTTKGMFLFTLQCPHSQLTAHQHAPFRSLPLNTYTSWRISYV